MNAIMFNWEEVTTMSEKPLEPQLVKRHAGIAVLKLQELMLAHSEKNQMRNKLRDMIEGVEEPRIVLDMTDVTAISSMMLGVIMALNLRIMRQNGKLRLCNVTTDVHVAFTLVKLDKIIPVDDSLYDSQEQLGG